MKKTFPLIALILALILCPVVSAVNVSFSNTEGSAERDILVYCYGVNTTPVLFGQYNTSSVGIPVQTDCTFQLRPHNVDILENPSLWLSTVAFPYAKTYFIPLLAIAVLVAIAFSRRRS